MIKTRLLLTVAAAIALVTGASVGATAQGITTGGVTGTVTDPSGAPIEGAQIQVRNPKTGYSVGALTRANGQFSVQGLLPDDGYSVTVRRIGFQPAARDNRRVALGETIRVDFQLEQQTAVLETVMVSAETNPVINPTKTGTGTTLSDSALRRLPTINRNFADFVRLTPQVTTSTREGLSGGGVNIRQNAIQIDGAASGDLFGLGTTGEPGAQANAKSIPLDAVKEYQILLSPFDVRQGNFGGILINAVTKSGTNQLHGTVYGYTRNENLTRKQDYLAEFKQQQYGFSLGGPILKDRLFFFVNPEWQKQSTPANGAYVGSTDSLITQGSIDLLNQALAVYGFNEGGSGGRVIRENPLTNIFARIDAFLPGNTRMVLRHNYAAADNTTFGRSSRNSSSPLFDLTSNGYEFSSRTNSSVAEFLTNLPNGAFNELLLNLTTTKDFRTVPVRFPEVLVRGFPRESNPAVQDVAIVVGTDASSQGNALDQRTFEFTNNLTIPRGSHSFTIGTKNLFYRPVNLFGQNSLGNWEFANLDSLRAGSPSRYQVSAPSPTDPANGLATFSANMFSFYVQDAWRYSDRLVLTAGLRIEKPQFEDTPPENPSVLQNFGRSTSAVPSKRTISPRFSFNWDITGDQRNQLRGGLGYFTGTPPFVYLSNAFGNSGLSGYASLNCSGSTTGALSLAPPRFNQANIDNPPTSCAPFTPTTPPGAPTRPGASTAASSNIATIDPNFRFPQYQKISAGYDHRFENGLVGSFEGLYTKSISNPFYTNLALVGPQGRDRNGRVLYGTLQATGGTALTRGGRTQVIDVTNVGGDYTYSLTGTIQKTFFETFQGSLAYSYMQARDVASTTSSTQGSNYRYQRDVAGFLADRSLTRSKNDMPHRIVGTGSWRLKTLTDISFIYIGNSGAPFDYVYGVGSGTGSGDANADGQSQNDLVYVPTSAYDQNEILFTGFNGTPAQQATAAEMADAFDKYIDGIACLRENRGKLLSRNLCRNPWQNQIDVSVAQSLQAFGRQNLQLRLDVINFANLLNKKWGIQRFSDQNNTCGPICSATTLLTQSGNFLTGRTQQTAQGIYTFNPKLEPFSSNNVSSNYRMQLSLRYSF